jgi:hypothetical protein
LSPVVIESRITHLGAVVIESQITPLPSSLGGPLLEPAIDTAPFTHLHIGNCCARRPVSHALQHCVYGFLRPLKHRFDAAVFTVAHPSGYTAPPRLTLRVIAKADALHAPVNAQMECDSHGVKFARVGLHPDNGIEMLSAESEVVTGNT